MAPFIFWNLAFYTIIRTHSEQEKEQAKQVAENIEKITGNDDIVQSNNKNAEYIVNNDAGTISIPHENDSQSIEIRGEPIL
ncbi:hypothetical protein P7H12_16200 [Paenibacillus larvae]|nr:hypothetical protein [Paenibacillus larvae]MDT2264825.1 hypothetical protein [Paenibacillus larvae]